MQKRLGMGSTEDRVARAAFWRRLTAMWVDSFVIYAMAAFLVELGAVT